MLDEIKCERCGGTQEEGIEMDDGTWFCKDCVNYYDIRKRDRLECSASMLGSAP